MQFLFDELELHLGPCPHKAKELGNLFIEYGILPKEKTYETPTGWSDLIKYKIYEAGHWTRYYLSYYWNWNSDDTRLRKYLMAVRERQRLRERNESITEIIQKNNSCSTSIQYKE